MATIYYLKAIATGSGMAIVCGISWGLIGFFMPFFYLNLLIAPGVGYAIGEVVSLSVNRKRGTRLAIIGGSALVASYLVGIFSPWGLRFGLLDIIAIALGVFVAVTRLR
jgi:uncharacterized membrane protein YuzA (DUF378 family)